VTVIFSIGHVSMFSRLGLLVTHFSKKFLDRPCTYEAFKIPIHWACRLVSFQACQCLFSGYVK